MDYNSLAEEFLRNMRKIRTANQGKNIQEGIRGEAFALYYIKGMEGRAIPRDISNAAGVSSARIAMVLNGLEEKGLITREIDSGDRRRIIVNLTPKGMERVEEMQKDHIEKMKDLLVSLGEEDAEDLVRITGRLAEVFGDQGRCDR